MFWADKIAADASVAMPVNIGCGMAGGKWNLYWQALCEWHDRHPSIRLTMVHQGLNTWMILVPSLTCTQMLILQNPTGKIQHLVEEGEVETLLKKAKKHSPPSYSTLLQPVPNGLPFLLFPNVVSYNYPLCKVIVLHQDETK